MTSRWGNNLQSAAPPGSPPVTRSKQSVRALILATFVEFAWEVTLFVIAYLGLFDIARVSGFTLALLHTIGLGVNVALVLWLLVESRWSTYGYFQSFQGTYLSYTVALAALQCVAAWTWQGRFHDVPAGQIDFLTTAEGVRALHVLRAMYGAGFAGFLVLVAIVLFIMRTNRLINNNSTSNSGGGNGDSGAAYPGNARVLQSTPMQPMASTGPAVLASMQIPQRQKQQQQQYTAYEHSYPNAAGATPMYTPAGSLQPIPEDGYSMDGY